MNTLSPQMNPIAWMSSIADLASWQSWPQSMHKAAGLDVTDSQMDPGIAPNSVAISNLQKGYDYLQDCSALLQNLLWAKTTALANKRFSAPAWQSHALHSFNAALYLLNAKFIQDMIEAAKAPPKIKQKIRFAVQQAIDALSPANFLLTNPEAQRKIIETKGESLAKGIGHLLADLQNGRISQSDESAFEVGTNVATTEGAVVFENELFQLIQYKPLTKTVRQRPLLLVPSCINKFYILDLQASNSLARYALEQGHSVFMVSWRNPDSSLAHATWDDYIEDGAIQAIEVVREITGQDKLNLLGFCIGGSMVATALAVLAARGQHPAASMTLLTTLLDYSDVGALDAYIDEVRVRKHELEIGRGGLMPGRNLMAAFSSLRPNELVWNYVEANYLKGQAPPAFDLLYWNADCTNLPGPMLCWSLRNLFLDNSLKEPGKLSVAGEQVDLGKIDTPAFIYASREDHIVPWTAAYTSTALLNPGKPSQNRFVLGASGHIAGVINPPSKNKRSYWINHKTSADATDWLANVTERPGSWWPEWAVFLAKHAGKDVNAPRIYGNSRHRAIEAAPGRYVKARANEGYASRVD